MHIQSILVLCLIYCSVDISAQNVDCENIYKSCIECARTVPQKDDVHNVKNINKPDACPKEVQDRWIWRKLTQCEVQRLYCQNPSRKFTCDSIAEMAKMRRRINPRCTTCNSPTRRTTRRPTRRTTRRPTRRTTRRPTRRTTRRPTRRTTRRRTTRTPTRAPTTQRTPNTFRPPTRPTTRIPNTARPPPPQTTRRTTSRRPSPPNPRKPRRP